jgi:hypothetical protein
MEKGFLTSAFLLPFGKPSGLLLLIFGLGFVAAVVIRIFTDRFFNLQGFKKPDDPFNAVRRNLAIVLVHTHSSVDAAVSVFKIPRPWSGIAFLKKTTSGTNNFAQFHEK